MDSKLLCTVTIEKLVSSNLHRNSLKNAEVVLSRNPFKELTINLYHKTLCQKYVLKDIKIYKRFLNEGKITICLPVYGIQLMISNSPPHQLKSFLGMLTIKKTKDEMDKENKPVAIREKMFMEKGAGDEISPITEKELAMVRAQQQGVKRKSTDATPVKGANKINRKKLCADDGKPGAKRFSPTVEQSQIVNAVLSGQSIFFTGCAGTGKSYLLKHILNQLPPDSTYTTASTGAAACHIGGTTLHAFAGIGAGKHLLAQCLEIVLRNRQAVQNWRKCKCLIIDEISMVDGDFFDKIEHVARVVRQNSKPFGGIQLVLCGDFLQLPPVTKVGEKKVFCFQGKSWSNCVRACFELTEVKRQRDRDFIEVLRHVRLGSCPKLVEEMLRNSEKRNIEGNGIQATKLCTHRDDVDNINRREIQNLPGQSKVFVSEDSDPALSKLLDNQCPALQRLELKVGTQVMLTKNIDVQKGLVNGARGVIHGFENKTLSLPIVKFVSGLQKTLGQERWTVKLAHGAVITRQQIPLRLAWAMSIHKSQGMTLDCVEISLGRVFECGQAYVALSRASSLDGLRVTNFSSSCIQAHPEVLKFYRALKFSKIQIQTIISKNNLRT